MLLMNRISATLVILLLFTITFVPTLVFAEPTGNFNIILGQKNLDEGDWEPLDEQPVFAMEADFTNTNWPASLLIGFSKSEKDDNLLLRVSGQLISANMEASTSEFYFGARKYFNEDASFTPYVSAGLSMVNAEIKVSALGSSGSSSDSTTGVFLNAGGVYHAGALNVGLDFRMLTGADVEIEGQPLDASHTQLGLVLGFNF